MQNSSIPENKAKVTVTARILFNHLEVTGHHRFRLDGRLFAQDPPVGDAGDASLVNFGSRFFPDSTPTAVENVKFEITVPASLLNEDAGTDQIYGKLVLVGLNPPKLPVICRTNVVTHEFKPT